MIRIHAYRIAFQVERELAVFNMFQLVLVQIWPSPDASINYMWKTFASRHLESSIQCSLNSDTLTWMRAVGGYSGDQTVQLVTLLLLVSSTCVVNL